jgi:hypothetical protein
LRTDAQGAYRFADLKPGLTEIEVIVPAGMQSLAPNPIKVAVLAGVVTTHNPALAAIFTPGPSPTPTHTATVTPTPTATRDPSWGKLVGKVHLDVDNDGIAEVDEPGVPGMTIVATHADNGAQYTSVSGTDGAFDLGGLPTGIWYVRVQAMPGWKQTDPVSQFTVSVQPNMSLSLPFGVVRLPQTFLPFILSGEAGAE